DVQVCLQHFAGDAPEPLVHGDIQEHVSCEQLQDHQVGIACVFDVVRCVVGNESDIVGVEVHGFGVVDRKEYGHAALAGDPVLPLGSGRVPVQFTHVSRLDDEHSPGNFFGD